jgi:hypothetical protein
LTDFVFLRDACNFELLNFQQGRTTYLLRLFVELVPTMLSRASTIARGTRFNVYRSFTSTTPLGDQYDIVVIGKCHEKSQ